MSQKLREKSQSSWSAEATELVKQCAEPAPLRDTVKAGVRRAAQKLGFTFNRTYDFWYGRAGRIDATEIDHLREQAALTRDQTVNDLVALRSRLATEGTPLNGSPIAALDHALRFLGVPIRARNVSTKLPE